MVHSFIHILAKHTSFLNHIILYITSEQFTMSQQPYNKLVLRGCKIFKEPVSMAISPPYSQRNHMHVQDPTKPILQASCCIRNGALSNHHVVPNTKQLFYQLRILFMPTPMPNTVKIAILSKDYLFHMNFPQSFSMLLNSWFSSHHPPLVYTTCFTRWVGVLLAKQTFDTTYKYLQ